MVRGSRLSQEGDILHLNTWRGQSCFKQELDEYLLLNLAMNLPTERATRDNTDDKYNASFVIEYSDYDFGIFLLQTSLVTPIKTRDR